MASHLLHPPNAGSPDTFPSTSRAHLRFAFRIFSVVTHSRFATLPIGLYLLFSFPGFIWMCILIVMLPIPLIPPQLTGIYYRRARVCFKTILELYSTWIFPVLQISLVNGLVITRGFQHKIRDFHVFGSLRYAQVPPTINRLKYLLD